MEHWGRILIRLQEKEMRHFRKSRRVIRQDVDLEQTRASTNKFTMK